MDPATRTALLSISAAHRQLADRLDSLLNPTGIVLPAQPAPTTEDSDGSRMSERYWDPESDAPLVKPKVVGTREEQDWCSLTYLGGIYAINKREGRGATAPEIRHYAIKAGYQDGRAVTAWSKGNGATQNDEGKQRWVTEAGVNLWVKGLAAKLGLTLPADLAEPWTAPDFSKTGS